MNAHERKLKTIDSKYAKYSTEQLEVILTHLTDPEAKELVKSELERRYYQHYRSLITNSGGQPTTSGAPDADAAAAPADDAAPGSGEETASSGDSLLSAAELEELPELPRIADRLANSQETPSGAAPRNPPGTAAQKKFCFIATAAFGTPWAAEVVLLQNFRDACLCRSPWGREFVRLYYRCSPSLARRIDQSRISRALIRKMLAPLIFLIKKIFPNLAA